MCQARWNRLIPVSWVQRWWLKPWHGWVLREKGILNEKTCRRAKDPAGNGSYDDKGELISWLTKSKGRLPSNVSMAKATTQEKSPTDPSGWDAKSRHFQKRSRGLGTKDRQTGKSWISNPKISCCWIWHRDSPSWGLIFAFLLFLFLVFVLFFLLFLFWVLFIFIFIIWLAEKVSNIVGKIQKYYGQKNLGSFKAKSHLPLLFFFLFLLFLWFSIGKNSICVT